MTSTAITPENLAKIEDFNFDIIPFDVNTNNAAEQWTNSVWKAFRKADRSIKELKEDLDDEIGK